MRIHEVEPLKVLPHVRAWEGLSTPARLSWAQANGHKNSARGAHGPDERAMLDAGLLDETPTGLRRVGRGALPLHVVVRTAARCSAFAEEGVADEAGLREYIRMTYNREERMALLGDVTGRDAVRDLAARAASRTWVQALLEARTPATWEARHLQSPWGETPVWEQLLTPAVHREVGLLVAELVAAGGTVRWSDLFGGASLAVHRRRAAALRAALRYLVVFPRLHPESAILEVGLLPSVARGLAASPAAELAIVVAKVESTSPFWVSDMVTVLLDAASGEARVKANGRELYQKTAERIIASLSPLPAHVERCARTGGADRLDMALWGIQLLDLVLVDVEPNGRRRLRPAPACRAWLSMQSLDRLRTLADLVRGEEPADEELIRWTYHKEAALLAPDVLVHDIALAGVDTHDLVAAIRAALATIPTEGAVRLDDWLGRQSRSENPLTGTGPAGHAFDRPRSAWEWCSPEEREAAWSDILSSAIRARLIPLGGIALGPEEAGPHIALTGIGRYLIRASNELDLPAPAASKARILVQANFDIVFMAPAPDIEALLAPFAERVGRDVGTLFHLTRDAATRAAAAGLSGEEALARLTQANAGPPPANIARSVDDWFSRVRMVEAARAWVLRCPDEETADRVATAGGDRVVRLGPRTVELDSRDLLSRIEKKLEKEGIFVERDESTRGDPAKPRGPRRRRRRRRW